MRASLIHRLSNLLSVKSLITLALTAVFAYMACKGIIAFYFGTQSRKTRETGGGSDAS